MVREEEAATYLRQDPKHPENYELVSPITGKIIRIKGVKARLSTSADALEALKEIEEQVIGMTVLPDFGYAEDNYIIPKGDEVSNKWDVLTNLLHNNDKYTWLLSQIKLRTLRKDFKTQEKELDLAKQRREWQKKRLIQASEQKKKIEIKQSKGKKELDDLIRLEKDFAKSIRVI